MTPNQRRRLAALAGKPESCLGCCAEDLRDAREELAELFRETSIRWSVDNKWRAFLGQDPEPWPSDEELQYDRAAAQADVDRATAAIQAVMKVPARRRKLSCPSCEAQRRGRKQCEDLVRQLQRNQRALKREQGGDWYGPDGLDRHKPERPPENS